MNETLSKLVAAAKQWVDNLTPRSRTMIAVGVGALVVLGAVVGLVKSQDPYQVLYSDLQGEEARAVAKKLGEEKIPHILSGDSTTVSVTRSQVARARMELAKAGLPGQDVVGFEKFDSATLGMSSYVQRIQYVRAVQGELTRSIQQLASVKRARVHISIPPKKTFLEEEEPPKASVILELKRGQKPSKAEVNGIAHLVASAVEGLKVANVSIVDTQGSFLHRPEDGSSAAGMSSALLENQRNMEDEFQRRVEEILTPVVGLGKVRAQISAEIDPSRVNTTEESFDADKAAVRQTVKNEESTNGTKPNPIGIPGSRSNLPGAEAVNPPVPMANTSSEKSISNSTYAIPRKIQVTDKPSGSLKRLTVAVIVDGYYQTVNGVEQFTPRSDEELRRLQDLVANSVGFDATRRDSITVSCLPFRNTDLAVDDIAVPPVGWLQSQPLYMKAIFAALVALVPMFFMGWLAARRRRREAAAAMALSPKTVAQLEAEMSGKPTLEADEDVLGKEVEPLEKKEELELRKRILERLTGTPKKGLAVIEEWLEEPDEKPRGTNETPLLQPV